MSTTSAALNDASSSAASRPLLSEKRKQDIKGAVQAGVEIASFVATVTQNVPYLGIISSSLSEIMKICDEVEECEGERKAVKGVVGEIKEIVDATRSQCDGLGGGPNLVPTALVQPLEKLQECIGRTQKALDECSLKSSDDRVDGRLRAVATRGQRLVRKVVNRNKFIGAMKQCRADMSSTLTLLNAGLSIKHVIMQDDQNRKLDDVHRMLVNVVNRMSNVDSIAHALDPSRSSSIERDHRSARQKNASPNSICEEQIVQIINWHALGRRIRGIILRFSLADQEVIWRALATLFSWTIESVFEDSDCTVTLTQPVRPILDLAQVMETTIPMMVTFILLFMAWRLHSVSRPLAIGLVTIVDFFGEEVFTLDSDTFSTWENTHAFLLSAFQGRPGVHYVENKTYGLGNSERLLIAAEEWSQVVRSGAHLSMSVLISERIPRCPYCRTLTTGYEELYHDGHRVICSRMDCRREYGTIEVEDGNVEQTSLTLTTAHKTLSPVDGEDTYRGSSELSMEDARPLESGSLLPDPFHYTAFNDSMAKFKRVLVQCVRSMIVEMQSSIGGTVCGAVPEIPIVRPEIVSPQVSNELRHPEPVPFPPVEETSDTSYSSQGGPESEFANIEHARAALTTTEILTTMGSQSDINTPQRQMDLRANPFPVPRGWRKPQVCDTCGAVENPAVRQHRLCGGCKTTRYCSPNCQKSHWPEHRAICQQTFASKQQPLSEPDLAKLLRNFASLHASLLGWVGFQALQLRRIPANARSNALLIELHMRALGTLGVKACHIIPRTYVTGRDPLIAADIARREDRCRRAGGLGCAVVLVQCGGISQVMPVEVDAPSTITWDNRADWEEVLRHFVESARGDFKPISTTSRGVYYG